MSQATTAAPRASRAQAQPPPPPAAEESAWEEAPTPGGRPADVGEYRASASGRAQGRQHPALAFSGIAAPSAYRAYMAAQIRHAFAGAAGTREADAFLAASVKKSDDLTWSQKARVNWIMRRNHRRLAGAYESVAKASARCVRARQEADAEVLAARKKKSRSGVYSPTG